MTNLNADESYYKDGLSWEGQIYQNMKSSRNRAWALTFISMAIALVSVLALTMLVPLKTFEPFVVSVDRNTGYLEVTKGLYSSHLSEDEALTQANLVRYLSARESYNPVQSVLRQNYDLISLLSSGNALKEYQELWNGNNPENPSVKLGHKNVIDIKIQSVSFLNEKVASIRFIKELHEANLTRTSIWNAVIEFQYVQKPMKMIDRFSNPLGFQVISYRINPEVMESTP